jgi:hypothetical protein
VIELGRLRAQTGFNVAQTLAQVNCAKALAQNCSARLMLRPEMPPYRVTPRENEG